jgi:hypothetical protein
MRVGFLRPLRGDLEAQRLRGFGVFITTQEQVPPCGGERTLKALQVRDHRRAADLPDAARALERRQAARRGAAVTPPYVVDVEVSRTPEETGR